jgi:hypothetical protein
MEAIEYLLGNKLIEDKPADIANFLYTTDNLNMAKIGDFISDP